MANGKRKIKVNKRLWSVFKGLIIYVLIAVAALIFFYQVSGGPKTSAGTEVPISQIVNDVKSGKIQKITLEGDKITAEVKDSDQKITSRKEAGESIYKILESSGVDPKVITIEIKDLSMQQAWIGRKEYHLCSYSAAWLLPLYPQPQSEMSAFESCLSKYKVGLYVLLHFVSHSTPENYYQ